MEVDENTYHNSANNRQPCKGMNKGFGIEGALLFVLLGFCIGIIVYGLFTSFS